MAAKITRLAGHLKRTVNVLRKSSHYEWGHSGACNCGHLAQVITGIPSPQLHRWALEKEGDWSEKSKVYCENSGYSIDNVISTMLRNGLSIGDIREIEYLNNSRVLNFMGLKKLRRNVREDVIAYFEGWIALLESDQSQGREQWEPESLEEKTRSVEYDTIPEDFRRAGYRKVAG